MQPNTAPDIYLMKREKSRAGCMVALLAVTIVAVLAGAFALVQWISHRGTDSTEPVEFPAAPILADLPPVPIPDTPPPKPPKSSTKVPAKPVPATPESVPDASAQAVGADSTQAEDGAPATGTVDITAQLNTARKRLQSGNFQNARKAALAALATQPGNVEVETFLSELAIPLLASTRPMPEKVQHTVQSGDYLGKIAATYNTPVVLIAKANGIQGANIRLGQVLHLLDGNTHVFALTVSKSRHDLVVTLGGQFFKRYRVSTGENAKTPEGTYKIVDKISQPAWHKPGGAAIPYGHPDNLLGTHWLALDLPGYGLHGTWDPDSIGKQTSAGCIRLLNTDIEELYSILPKGTLCTIIE